MIISMLPVAAPDLLDPKAAVHNSKPRLSFSTKPVVLNTPEDECDTRTTVMRWKTVSAIFFLVVLYLIIGATVFQALEQPHESYQKSVILKEKLEFLALHSCINSTELEDLVKAGVIFSYYKFCWLIVTDKMSFLLKCALLSNTSQVYSHVLCFPWQTVAEKVNGLLKHWLYEVLSEHMEYIFCFATKTTITTAGGQ